MRTFEEWRFSFFRVLGYANFVILSNRRKNYKITIKCTLVDALSMNQQYENERRLLAWAKAQRGYAFFAFIPTVVGGAVTIAHLVDEATALKDIEEWEKRQGE